MFDTNMAILIAGIGILIAAAFLTLTSAFLIRLLYAKRSAKFLELYGEPLTEPSSEVKGEAVPDRRKTS